MTTDTKLKAARRKLWISYTVLRVEITVTQPIKNDCYEKRCTEQQNRLRSQREKFQWPYHNLKIKLEYPNNIGIIHGRMHLHVAFWVNVRKTVLNYISLNHWRRRHRWHDQDRSFSIWRLEVMVLVEQCRGSVGEAEGCGQHWHEPRVEQLDRDLTRGRQAHIQLLIYICTIESKNK